MIGSKTLTKFFLKNPSEHVEGKKPEFICGAIKWNRPGIVQTLIEMGINVNSVFDVGNSAFKQEHGYTPIHVAVMECLEDIVKILYNKGADIGAEGLHKYSPLHIAVIDGKVRTHLLNKSNFWHNNNFRVQKICKTFGGNGS